MYKREIKINRRMNGREGGGGDDSVLMNNSILQSEVEFQMRGINIPTLF